MFAVVSCPATSSRKLTPASSSSVSSPVAINPLSRSSAGSARLCRTRSAMNAPTDSLAARTCSAVASNRSRVAVSRWNTSRSA